MLLVLENAGEMTKALYKVKYCSAAGRGQCKQLNYAQGSSDVLSEALIMK